MATEQELAQALGPAFGIYPKAFRGNTGNLQDAANLPVDVMRGRTAGLLGLPSDLLNMFQSPKPMEVFGDVQYEPKIKVPYDTEHFLKTLPLAPTSRAGQVAGQVGSFVPLNPAPLVRAGVAGAKALAPTAARMTEGYLQRQGLMPGVMPEQPSLLGNMTTKPKAEVSPLGFYSAVEQQALNIPRKQGSGESFLNDLAKGQDVKKYEMETMGLNEFLRGKPNVTRQEVQDFIAGNRINVQEKQLGAAVSEDPIGIAQRKAVFDKYEPQIQALYKDIDSFGTPREVSQNADNQLRALQEMRDAEANAVYTVPESTPTKYERYQLPGGENYREILLTLPAAGEDVQKLNKISLQLHGKPYTDLMADTSEMAKMRLAVKREYKSQFGESGLNAEDRGIYRSSHFDEPNILAHMRVNDRIDADGKKMLLIEEVQSDWHQAGREKGYAPKNAEAQLAASKDRMAERSNEIRRISNRMAELNNSQLDEFNALAQERQRLQDLQGKETDWGNRIYDAKNSGVPDAPFKDTWHQLALKRALKEAVDKGYDRIGLTTGAQQAERYNLAKQVDEVIAKRNPDGSFNLDATLVGGGTQQSIGKNIAADKLADYVGKDLAKTMQSQTAGTDVYSGDALKVGGEGMKKYYDEIYPAFLNKQGKKYGAQMGEVEIGLPPKTSNSWAYFRDWFAENHGNVGSSSTALSNWEQGANNKYVKEFEKFRKAATQTEKVRYLDITPEMRKAIKEGQPIASIQNELAKALA